MNLLHRYLMVQFFQLFPLALGFFVLVLLISDLFANLSNLLSAGVPLLSIFYLTGLHTAQSASWALTPALLFSVAFVLGNLYAHNELVVILGSGVSLRNFVFPLFVLGLLLSGFSFFLNDRGVIPAEKARNELKRTLTGTGVKSNSNVALIANEGRVFYSASNYTDQTQTLQGVVLLVSRQDASLVERIDADYAAWLGDRWEFHEVKRYTKNSEGKFLLEALPQYSDPRFNSPPEYFQRRTVEMSEMTFAEAQTYVQALRHSGFPSVEQETEVYQRISFSFSPFVVVWISTAIGGRFRKNILLMSLLMSLLISSAYVILQIIFGLVAKLGFAPPWLGASAGILAGAAAGIILFLRAKT